MSPPAHGTAALAVTLEGGLNMHDGSMWFLGMHALWWVFWIALLIWAYRWAMSQVRKAGSAGRDTPLDVLQHRYAAGEITTQEYEERKAKLTRDREVG